MTTGTPSSSVVVDLEDENSRYHRQELISWWDQGRLAAARVLVVGAGALGNEVVKNLALIGVGTIVVVDMDRVENSNLARCIFFRPDDEGRRKATALAAAASSVNPDVAIVPAVGDIRLVGGLGLFEEVDLVIGGLDNREARLFVNQACWKTSTPWIDGAIEGLMGVARVFVPPESPCYECTMNEIDFELIAQRRTCALLSRDEMLEGKTPTTATTSSVVAGIQVQEAVKLLHRDRVGASPLEGAGLQFVGHTHDSYVVRYARREECLSHDTYDLAAAETVAPGVTFGGMLDRACTKLGSGAVLELEHEIVVSASCSACATDTEVRRPVEALRSGDGLCPGCGTTLRLTFLHCIDGGAGLLDLTPEDLGLPPHDVVVGRVGMERCYFRLGGPGSVIAALRRADRPGQS